MDSGFVFSMCCCVDVGFFWEFARGSSAGGVTRLVGYSSASLESSYETGGLKIADLAIEQTVTPVATSSDRIWVLQTESSGADRYFSSFDMAGNVYTPGLLRDFSSLSSGAEAIEELYGNVIQLTRPKRVAAYPSNGAGINTASVDGKFCVFTQTGTTTAASTSYGGVIYTFPYKGSPPADDSTSPNSSFRTGYWWDGDLPVRMHGFHVENFEAIENAAAIEALVADGWVDEVGGGPIWRLAWLQGGTLTPTFFIDRDAGTAPDAVTGDFVTTTIDRVGIAESTYNAGLAANFRVYKDFNRWKRYFRGVPNFRLIAGTPNTSKYVLAQMQEVISDTFTLDSSTSDGESNPGFRDTYTREWTIRQKLVIGVFDPVTCGVVHDDEDEPLRVLHTLADVTDDNQIIVLPWKFRKYDPIEEVTNRQSITPVPDPRVFQPIGFTPLAMPTVAQWDMSRDGLRWCARLTGSANKILVNGHTIDSTSIGTTPGAANSTLSAWAMGYDATSGFDSRYDWPRPYAEWPALSGVESIDDVTTNYSKAVGYRWYTVSAGVVLAIDGPPDLERGPSLPATGVTAIVYYHERSWLPTLITTGPGSPRWGVREWCRLRFEFWENDTLRGTTYSKAAIGLGNTGGPALNFAFSHGEYVYTRALLWDQVGPDPSVGVDQVWRPRTMEFFYAAGSAYPDLGVSGPTSVPFFNLYRWPLPHNDWSVVEPRAVTWLPMNTP